MQFASLIRSEPVKIVNRRLSTDHRELSQLSLLVLEIKSLCVRAEKSPGGAITDKKSENHLH